MDVPDGFLGHWQLVPELSLYALGPPPLRGTYLIRRDGDTVQLQLRWAMPPDGPEQAIAFGGPMDGTPQPVADAGSGAGPDSFTLTRVDASTLDSAALRNGAVVAYARRVVSADGSLLAVVQEGPHPEGGRFRNFQVYRRVPPDDHGAGSVDAAAGEASWRDGGTARLAGPGSPTDTGGRQRSTAPAEALKWRTQAPRSSAVSRRNRSPELRRKPLRWTC